jgi:hypothetical protein
MHVMSQQSDMADAVYSRLEQGEVPAAELVQELRAKWGPEHRAPEVHRFVEEVAACLLHRDDVEAGDMTTGHFTPWSIEPWEAHKKIQDDLMSMASFLEDKTQYVFRRAQKT